MLFLIIQILFCNPHTPELICANCQKCDIGKIRVVYDNLDQLEYEMVMEFLCTLDSSYRTNVEYSEGSNEMIYVLLEHSPGLLFQALQDDRP